MEKRMILDSIQGFPLVLGDNISSDVILHGRYSLLNDPGEMAKHVLEDLGPQVSEKVQNCAVIVAGRNFGCGPGREATVVALKAAGVRVILARSFFRMFFRNAINHGIVPIEWTGGLSLANKQVEVSIQEGTVKIGEESMPFKKLPDKLLEILRAGGLVAYGRQKLVGR